MRGSPPNQPLINVFYKDEYYTRYTADTALLLGFEYV
jgi:hypothetical protein